ncbi:hypothetical protein [Methylotenera versatilis]|uniref:hypothetical protein n=1 Tax=Methylotenera versatilis TaxID=1055487 RepID=UPI0006473CE9|nr:hypothetical protein [Methylotenera versatilis]
MQLKSKIYKSADMDPRFLSTHIDDYRQGDTYGYFIIDDMLVPKSLVSRMFEHLSDSIFEYGYVWPIQELLGSDFWSKLDEYEQSVAPACMLIIIENGYSFPVLEDFQIKH